MTVNFLHGVETIEKTDGPRPITVVKSAVIGLIGTAPAGPVNQPVLLYNEDDIAQFGPELPGFTIPQALRAWAEGGAGTVFVVNVLDPEEHVEAVEGETVQFHAVTGRARLAHGAISDLVLTDGAEVTYVLGTDYEILDPLLGEIRAKTGGAIAFGSSKVADYNYLDPTQVIAADIIGSIDVDGNRSGIEALRRTFNLYGFNAKILEAPVYSTQNSVRVALEAMADKLKAVSLVDAPIGTTVSEAIAGRGPSGAINFNTSNGRTMLLYPHLTVYDKLADQERLEPYSQRFASVICRTDLTKGYWKSPSNEPIPGVIGLERELTAAVNRADTDVNALNEAGITTVFNSQSSGLRTWGNRCAAYPSNTHPLNFLSVRRTADMIEESIELASLQFVDEPGSPANIETVLATANEFIRTLIQRGAILDGRAWWDATKNPQVNLAAGNYAYCYDFMPPTPMERITWIAYINMTYLAQLSARMAA